MKDVIFLKLGGSLITDKSRPHTPRTNVIDRIAQEVQNALEQSGGISLIIGHGSGSFGHVPGNRYQTRAGVYDEAQWSGFAEVWSEARALNQILIQAFVKRKIPVIAFPPSASAISRDGKLQKWMTQPVHFALEHDIIPIIYGDVVFDRQIGGTILSTEDLFAYLAKELKPRKILLAGMEEGVWKDYPSNTILIQKITPSIFFELKGSIGKSDNIDVTGGMHEKVSILMQIIQNSPSTQGMIFSGMVSGNIEKALSGDLLGTAIMNE